VKLRNTYIAKKPVEIERLGRKRENRQNSFTLLSFDHTFLSSSKYFRRIPLKLSVHLRASGFHSHLQAGSPNLKRKGEINLIAAGRTISTFSVNGRPGRPKQNSKVRCSEGTPVDTVLTLYLGKNRPHTE
jgi:hypothetical protein